MRVCVCMCMHVCVHACIRVFWKLSHTPSTVEQLVVVQSEPSSTGDEPIRANPGVVIQCVGQYVGWCECNCVLFVLATRGRWSVCVCICACVRSCMPLHTSVL